MKKYILLLCINLLLTGCWTTQKGEKIGTIVKLAKEGIIIKTNEAELIRGGLQSGGHGSFGIKPFDFTIENDDLYNLVDKAIQDQSTVKIKYHKEAFTLWRCESNNYFLDSIEIIN